MSEEKPTDKELRQAESLARSLDTGHKDEQAPAEALEAAALLKASRADSVLDETRSEAVLERILDREKERLRKSASRPWLRWLVPVGSLTAAALVAVVVTTSIESSAPPGLPAPHMQLLKDQAAAAAGDSDALASLRLQMRQYRHEMLTRLKKRYKG